MEKKSYLEIAKIINTHGVRGEVKLDPWCDSPEHLKKIKHLYLQDGTEFSVSGVKLLNGGFAVCKLGGVDTVEAAMRLKNKVLLTRREEIPKAAGAHFIADLIGLPVIDAESGIKYGVLDDVIEGVAQEIYAVKTEAGETVLLPNVPAFVRRVDEDEGIFITPIDGFFS